MAANVSVARRYARALLEVAAEANALDKVAEQLSALATALKENAELTDLFDNPAYDRAQKLKVVDALTQSQGLHMAVANLLRLLVERNRTSSLPDIQRLFADLADVRSGRVRGKISSAVALPADVLSRLEKSLETLTQRDVVLETKVDPSLIGGVSAQVGNTVIDGSVSHQLELIRRELRDG